MCAIHARRVTIQSKDIQLARRLRGERRYSQDEVLTRILCNPIRSSRVNFQAPDVTVGYVIEITRVGGRRLS